MIIVPSFAPSGFDLVDILSISSNHLIPHIVSHNNIVPSDEHHNAIPGHFLILIFAQLHSSLYTFCCLTARLATLIRLLPPILKHCGTLARRSTRTTRDLVQEFHCPDSHSPQPSTIHPHLTTHCSTSTLKGSCALVYIATFHRIPPPVSFFLLLGQ